MGGEYIKQKLLEIWQLKNYKRHFNIPLNLTVETNTDLDALNIMQSISLIY